MRFCSRFFIALLAVCVAPGVWANCVCDDGGCGVNEYCKRIVEIDHGHAVSSTECTPCPTGSIPTNACNSCEVSNVCDGYDDPCPAGTPTGAMCKKNTTTCPSPCSYYEICYPWLPATQMEELVIGACHMENDTCYSNTRACNMFANRTENYDISCAQSSQQGQAEWNGNAWNVGNCGCDITNVEIGTGPFGIPWWCDSFNADFHVSSANQNVSSASGKIVYTLSRMYCAKCHPGYLPKIETSAQINGIYVRPENSGNGNWGVGMCSEQVTQPDYADGCVIKFNLPTGADAYDDCRKECPTGFKTQEQGAESINDCVAQYTPDFEDQTGTFVLTSLDSCP